LTGVNSRRWPPTIVAEFSAPLKRKGYELRSQK